MIISLISLSGVDATLTSKHRTHSEGSRTLGRWWPRAPPSSGDYGCCQASRGWVGGFSQRSSVIQNRTVHTRTDRWRRSLFWHLAMEWHITPSLGRLTNFSICDLELLPVAGITADAKQPEIDRFQSPLFPPSAGFEPGTSESRERRATTALPRRAKPLIVCHLRHTYSDELKSFMHVHSFQLFFASMKF